LEGSHTGPAPSEQDAIRHQVAQAVAAGRYKAAWNQEIEAGAERARLEAVALAALAHDSGQAEAMFAALRAKWGNLGPSSRARVEALVAEAKGLGKWTQALRLELKTADDPPAYKLAWALYASAPVDRASALLGDIKDAQADAKEAAAEAGGEKRDG